MTDASAPTIGVTGGTGFIGRHVVAHLIARGYRVVVFARSQRSMGGPLEGAELRARDLSAPLDGECFAGCEVLVNLVGIKREAAGQSWESIHVELPRRLAAAAVEAGVRRMIHLSVAGADRADEAAGPYLSSKARGDAALRDPSLGALELTILRPGVVYGRGDDMLRNLADSIRAAPVFPAPRGGRAPIQPIAVEDVADAVLRCIERPASAGRDYELVGPERLELRELIARVAAHPRVDRPCLVAPAPVAPQRLIAAVLERVSTDPLITRSQLELLERGVIGDPEPARLELGLEARPLDDAAIEHALAEFEARIPSVRLVPDPAAAAELRELAGDGPSSRAWIFAAVAVATLLAGPSLFAPWTDSIWLRMACSEALLSVLALSLLGLRWRELARPKLGSLAWGLGAGLVMWGRRLRRGRDRVSARARSLGRHELALRLGQRAPARDGPGLARADRRG